MANMYFRFGAMNCGKSTALLQVAYNYCEQNMKVLLIKPLVDKKAGNKVSSRIGIEKQVDLLLSEDETIKENIVSGKVDISNLNAILVDEAQFLTSKQVNELWVISKLCDIPVICYGLKTNFKGELFEGSKALLEKSDKLEELSTICKCGNKARFNSRVENNNYVYEGKEIAIDGLEATYEPLCGKCYIQKVLKIEKY